MFPLLICTLLHSSRYLKGVKDNSKFCDLIKLERALFSPPSTQRKLRKAFETDIHRGFLWGKTCFQILTAQFA